MFEVETLCSHSVTGSPYIKLETFVAAIWNFKGSGTANRIRKFSGRPIVHREAVSEYFRFQISNQMAAF